MAVSVAEYLGQRTDVDENIVPVPPETNVQCPFMDRTCDKVSKGLAPICSVRKTDGSIWITCEHRLCSSRRINKNKKPIGLVLHQQTILLEIAKFIYNNDNLKEDEIGIKREVKIPLPESGNSYHADYVMRNFSSKNKVDEILLEMQGGGETSNTGNISTNIDIWSKQDNPTNSVLASIVKASTLETNAWRRQQEQFLVKGNVVDQTGGKIVFAVGLPLYEYLYKRIKNANLRDLRRHNWTLCLLPIEENNSLDKKSGPVPLRINKEKAIFTNYSTFVRFLTDQGSPCPEIFEGEFTLLNNEKLTV
ncbi:hypothetical protein [Xenorhabdus innexi]|uniref:Restriction endonuclease NotI n=1 Tax=Xenorhabdus innexi TaxID=290109 RepID=A0A2G0N306_9GAMM|nr:hypothetical protein [Xenorhabdus innexi]PHM29076.1 hypothetical protein Xinn_03742 [Xenorhabdus innexi]